MGQTALLMLADGTCFEGRAIGAGVEAAGELVFDTSLCGYQEILTDPAQTGRLIVFTQPHMGNYGVCPADNESDRSRAAGLICVELSELTGHWRGNQSLGDWMKKQGMAGIEGIDVRLLARHLRDNGSQGAVISSLDADRASLLEKARAVPSMKGRDLAMTAGVSTKTAWTPETGFDVYAVPGAPAPRYADADISVAVLDFGVTRSLLRKLSGQGLGLTLFPAGASARDVLDSGCRGVVLSDGPGDPAACADALQTVKELMGKLPLFGVGFGFHLLALALGGQLTHMKHGYHGANIAVRRAADGMFLSTEQHHSFVVDEASLPGGSVAVTYRNAVDGTVAGLSCTTAPAFGVQFIPPADPAPGLSDEGSQFARFRQILLSQAATIQK